MVEQVGGDHRPTAIRMADEQRITGPPLSSFSSPAMSDRSDYGPAGRDRSKPAAGPVRYRDWMPAARQPASFGPRRTNSSMDVIRDDERTRRVRPRSRSGTSSKHAGRLAAPGSVMSAGQGDPVAHWEHDRLHPRVGGDRVVQPPDHKVSLVLGGRVDDPTAAQHIVQNDQATRP
jgi:hypothetical protein